MHYVTEKGMQSTHNGKNFIICLPLKNDRSYTVNLMGGFLFFISERQYS